MNKNHLSETKSDTKLCIEKKAREVADLGFLWSYEYDGGVGWLWRSSSPPMVAHVTAAACLVALEFMLNVLKALDYVF